MKKGLLPLLMVILFYSDSVFMLFFSEQAFDGAYTPVPRFFLIGLLMMAVFFDRNTAIKYGFFFGFLFDMFYTGLLGAYFFFLPLLVYITSKLTKWLHGTLPVLFIIILFDVALIELMIYGLNVLVQRTAVSFEQFAYVRLIAVLVLNGLFYMIFAIPLRNAFIHLKKVFD
ncbi:rod shape-determining protein MreD [Domibacillus enclensis]|uniref:Rod shape-determining protein MreD n=1 Tax=Domibacillus enclensis TaxID=1017273 RepID=A0A1N6PZ21_9BACI|nr:rod shape-determining protein MreD [Domibacillus enclensis]OXS80531.1 rod shape-determining protein MreD [Domibacillus enclensis]SIQ09694.1 rod shape-determining protein MreD [Domibacillus enclensis]